MYIAPKLLTTIYTIYIYIYMWLIRYPDNQLWMKPQNVRKNKVNY